MANVFELKEQAAALESVLAQIRKHFGEGAIMRMGGAEVLKDIPCISTGSFSLDMALVIAMEDEARWMMQNGLTTAQHPVDLGQSIYPDALEAIRPGAVTLVR